MSVYSFSGIFKLRWGEQPLEHLYINKSWHRACRGCYKPVRFSGRFHAASGTQYANMSLTKQPLVPDFLNILPQPLARLARRTCTMTGYLYCM